VIIASELPYELPPYLSPSSISTYVQCPLKYKYSRVNKLSEPPTEATLMGNFVHDVLEYFYLNIEPADRNIASLKNVSSSIWTGGEWAEKVIPFIKDGLNTFRWNSWWCLENIFKVESPVDVVPAGVETELNGSIGGFQIKGYIDRWSILDGKTTISDYKTGKTPKARYVGDKFTQLLIYAIVLADTKDVEIDLVELLYLKDGTRFSQKFTSEDADNVSKMVESVGNQIAVSFDNNEWEAIPAVLCNWCFFKKDMCEYWKNK
jgi:putative RecB family exonuclease